MENKNDIGKVISDKLNALHRTPREQVWLGINKELDKKKKKRRFFFWMFFTAIAIGTLSTFLYFQKSNAVKPTNSAVSVAPTISNLNDTKSNTLDLKNKNEKNLNEKTNDESRLDNEANKKSEFNDNSNSNKNHNSNRKTGLNENPNSKVNLNSNNRSRKNSASKENSKNPTEIYFKGKKHTNKLSGKSKKTKYKNESESNKGESSLLAKNKAEKASKKSKKSSSSDSTPKPNKTDPSNLSNESGTSNESSKNNDVTLDALKKANENTTLTSSKDKKTSLNELKKVNQKKRDSIISAKKAEKEKKNLSENSKEEEQKDSTKTEVTATDYEITVAPYFGMNYTGNFGNGNFLNDSKTSKKESEFNSSYGALIRIMGSKKIGLQVGVGIINSVYSSTFIKESNSFIGTNTASLNTSLEELNVLFPNQTKVISRQETTFIEVPLEAYYVLSDKNFGMATSFGISFLKLQKNELFLESEDINRMSIGKLENITPFSSSINVKFNLFYKITSKLNIDLYPSFQYQFMGYKDVSNYHPYFFSIKTGLSYKL